MGWCTGRGHSRDTDWLVSLQAFGGLLLTRLFRPAAQSRKSRFRGGNIGKLLRCPFRPASIPTLTLNKSNNNVSYINYLYRHSSLPAYSWRWTIISSKAWPGYRLELHAYCMQFFVWMPTHLNEQIIITVSRVSSVRTEQFFLGRTTLARWHWKVVGRGNLLC